jgi:hypothetical protein
VRQSVVGQYADDAGRVAGTGVVVCDRVDVGSGAGAEAVPDVAVIDEVDVGIGVGADAVPGIVVCDRIAPAIGEALEAVPGVGVVLEHPTTSETTTNHGARRLRRENSITTSDVDIRPRAASASAWSGSDTRLLLQGG